eukprot:scaffold195807_cov18-Prasinocladus_malaysianus.AAC.1
MTDYLTLDDDGLAAALLAAATVRAAAEAPGANLFQSGIHDGEKSDCYEVLQPLQFQIDSFDNACHRQCLLSPIN